MKHASCSLATLAAAWLAAAASAQTQTAILRASDGHLGNSFGASLDLQGDLALIGAPGADDKGAVYAFERGPSGWVEVQKLVASDGQPWETFGVVAMDGEWAVIGAPAAGAAYVFQHTPGGWVEVQKIVGSTTDPGFFGMRVSISGIRIAVSSPVDDSTGSVYVFEHLLPVWKQAARITDAPAWDDLDLVANRLLTGNRFSDQKHALLFEPVGLNWALIAGFPGTQQTIAGFRVALGEDQAFVAAPFYNGKVRVYERGDGTWPHLSTIKNPLFKSSFFGGGLAVEGDRLVIGATNDGFTIGHGSDVGAAYLYRSGVAGWEPTAKLTASDGQAWDLFGARIAVSGETILVGAPAPGFTGKAYVFEAPDVARVFCRCTAGGPCGNDYPLGGCVSSHGEGGALGASGSASLGADDLVLSATQLPLSQFGLVFMGDAVIAPVVLADGLRCVGGNLFRFPPRVTGPGGTFDEGPGIVAHSASFGAGGTIVAGSTWHFQAWVRDPAGPCGQGSNLTDALSVTFTP